MSEFMSGFFFYVDILMAGKSINKNHLESKYHLIYIAVVDVGLCERTFLAALNLHLANVNYKTNLGSRRRGCVRTTFLSIFRRFFKKFEFSYNQKKILFFSYLITHYHVLTSLRPLT